MGGSTSTGSGGSRNPFDDPFFGDFNSRFDSVQKNVNRGFGAIIAIWIVSAVLSLAFFGVIIWAIIALVNHFTA